MWTNDAKKREEFLRNIIDLGVETTKIDFKRTLEFDTKEKTVELLKDISAIANSDDGEHNGYGFIIFGVQGQKITHDVPLLSSGKRDNTSAVIRQKLREYIWPEPKFDVIGFDEVSVGSWGVIVIPPSDLQPHFFIKEFNNEKLVIRKGNWFVRKGDTTCTAEPEDYTRILEKKIKKVTLPLIGQINSLNERILRLETLITVSGSPNLQIGFSSPEEKELVLVKAKPDWFPFKLTIRNMGASPLREPSAKIFAIQRMELARSRHQSSSVMEGGKVFGGGFRYDSVEYLQGFLSERAKLLRPGETIVFTHGYLKVPTSGTYTLKVSIFAANLPEPFEETVNVKAQYG